VIVCIHENRRSEEPGLRLLICSLAQHCPDVGVALFTSDLSDGFLEWASRKVNIVHHGEALDRELYWSVKHAILKYCITDLGFSEVVWLDSDIFVTQDLKKLFSHHAPGSISITQETRWGITPHDDNALRCRLWGFEPGRFHPFALNTCVIRVSRDHLDLLKRWQELNESAEYKNASNLPFGERLPHVRGDQELLTALLASKEFSHIPIDYMELGQDIVHCFGLKAFSLSDRFTWMTKGKPTFIHAQRNKPWDPDDAGKPALQKYYESILPNYVLAPSILERCGEKADWTQQRSGFSAAAQALGFGYPPLIGIFCATLFDTAYGLRRKIKSVTGR
jgi:hypothetical protein